MKKKRGFIAAAGILLLGVLIGLYVLVKGLNKEETQSEEEEQQEEIMSVKSEEVESLSFSLEGKEVTWKKTEEEWNMEGDEKFPADSTKIENLLSPLSSLKASRKLENMKNLKDYGLEDPQNTITVKKKGGEEEKIVVGDKNPSTDDTYIYLNEEKSTIYTISEDLADIFSGGVYDFAKGEEYPSLISSNIKKIQVEKEENAYTLESDADSSTSWIVKDQNGESKEADASSAGSLQTSAAGLEYSGYYEFDCEDWSSYGLDKPSMTLILTYTEEESEEEKTLTLNVGELNEEGNYYVRLNESQEVHGMSQASLESFMMGKAFDYLNKSVDGINIADLDHLDVTYNGTVYTLKRTVTEEKKEEVSEDSGDAGEEDITTVTTYYVNDKEADSTKFMDFYREAVSMVCQNRLESDTAKGEPELILHYVGTDGREITVQYTPRDASFYTVSDQNRNYGLVNKMSVKDLIDQFVVLISQEK